MARETWTDERLDDLNAKVDRGFERVDKRFEQVDRRFEQLDARFDALQRTLITAVIALCSCMITGFAGVIALQLGS